MEKKYLRISLGVSDNRNDYSSTQTPGMNLGTVNSIADGIGVINDIVDQLRQYAEIGRSMELMNLKNALEASMPKGEEAELMVSGYQPEKGFESVGVYPSGQTTLSSDDRTSLQRPETVQLKGKGNSLNDLSVIGVLPADVRNTMGVEFIPSSQKTEYHSHDGMRIEGRRTDSMSRPERDFYDHPDRRWA